MSMTRNEFKQEAAIRAMEGLIVANPDFRQMDADIIARFAICYAEALTDALDKTGDFYVPPVADTRVWEKV